MLVSIQIKAQSLPQAEFSSNSTNFCEGSWVDFIDLSIGTPTSWNWTFDGGLPGTSTQQNPVVNYASAGIYNVQLVVSNETGTDTILKKNYITSEPILPASVSLETTSNPTCLGTSVLFKAIDTNGGPNPSYSWFLNGNLVVGSTGATFTTSTLANNDKVFCIMTSSLVCVSDNPAMSNTITMTVNPSLPTGVHIAASENSICEGTPIEITATPVNGGLNPIYNWLVNGVPVLGNNSNSLPSSIYNNNDMIMCHMTSSAMCVIGNPALSNLITMQVQPTPVILTMQTSQNVCSGNSSLPVQFTSNISIATYEWTSEVSSTTISGNIISGTGDIPAQTLINSGTSIGYVTYKVIPKAYGCIGNAFTYKIFVNLKPNVSFNTDPNVCINEVAFPLTGGTPLNGYYTGDGVSAGYFDAATAGEGTHIITYHYIDLNGCYASSNDEINVKALPIVDLVSFPSMCINGTSILLSGGTPLNGNYSIDGNDATYFNPQTQGVGIHYIKYKYTDENGCSNTDIATIKVNDLPIVTLNAFASKCIDAFPFTLTGGNPLYGEYNGTGVDNGTFYPNQAGVGYHEIYYKYTDINGCTNVANANLTVNNLPAVIQNSFSSVCLNATPFTLTGGNPLNGTYSGTGVSNNEFDPTIAGVGSQLITYSYTDGNGCSNSVSSYITVNELPEVSFIGLDALYCLNSPAVTLNGSPANGTFSGNGMIGSTFDPAVAGVGNHDIVYSFTDENTCTNSSLQSVVVSDCLGFEDAHSDGLFSIYPNPTSGSFVIETPSSGNYLMQIYDALGQKVVKSTLSNKTNYSIDINTLSSGIYYIVIPKSNFSKKLVVL